MVFFCLIITCSFSIYCIKWENGDNIKIKESLGIEGVKLARYIELEYKDIKENDLLVDLRSEGEYADYTIPGAINIPILNNEERKAIGTVYKNESQEKAKSMGVRAASEKLPYIYESIQELRTKHKRVVLFCARGGMRSTILDKFLVSLGLGVYKLKDGYKAYRAFINEQIPIICEDIEYVVLQGNTGTGKTMILKELKERGHDILDLEGCANHRGSFLGSVGIGEGKSQKKFESLIYDELKSRKGNLILVEGESKRIGRTLIPDCIYEKMVDSKRLLIQASLDKRASNIIEEYIQNENWKQETLEGLEKLERYMGEKQIKKYNQMLEDDQIEDLVKDLMKRYYDPMYKKGEDKYKYEITVDADDIDKACDTIEKWLTDNK